MSLMDLFTPPKVRIPARARRVTLVGVETSEEAIYLRQVESLKKARASIKAPRGPKPPADRTAAEKLRREKEAKYQRDWYARHQEKARAAARERMRRQREADPEKYRQRNAEGYLRHAEARKAAMRARYAAMTPEQRRLRSRRANRQRSAAQTHDGAPE
ncbi:MAG: hypothetical protein ACK5VE_00260 [Alphaproteobacteria bacterium]